MTHKIFVNFDPAPSQLESATRNRRRITQSDPERDEFLGHRHVISGAQTTSVLLLSIKPLRIIQPQDATDRFNRCFSPFAAPLEAIDRFNHD
jgi:hypothetical protein